MDRLKRSRSAHKGVVTRMKSEITKLRNSSEDVPPNILLMYIQNLERKEKDIIKKNDEIEQLAKDENIEEELISSEEALWETNEQLSWLREMYKNKNNSSLGRNEKPIRLPKIDIPKFSGNYEEWMSFSDIFTSTILDNKSLSDVEKLQYLKGSLVGEAARLVQSFKITSANMQLAWESLKDRYHDKRQIVNLHYSRLFSFHQIRAPSSNTLRNLLSTFSENKRALQTHGIKFDECESLLVALMSSKFDAETKREWALYDPGPDLQSWDRIVEFLDGRSKALETASYRQSQSCEEPIGRSQNRSLTTVQGTCPSCSDRHRLMDCNKFKSLNVRDRRELVKDAQLCFNCLSSGHRSSSCSSKTSCRACSSKHHTMLHLDNASTLSSASNSEVLLQTTMVSIQCYDGSITQCRALLDTGSQINLVSSALVKRLGITPTRKRLTLNGVGTVSTTTLGGLDITLILPDSSGLNISCQTLDHIAPPLPIKGISTSHLNLEKYEMADPSFGKPSPIDLLLGVEVYESVVSKEQHQITPSLTLRNTKFGWVISGRLCASSNSTDNPIESNSFTSAFCTQPETCLQRFWELESVPDTKIWTKEEKDCEAHFKATTKRDKAGRYMVKLPFKQNCQPLQESYLNAKRRFLSLERRLESNSHLKNEYHNFIHEFVELGHMEETPQECLNKSPSEVFYLPHHCVHKEDSTSTKLRVVFDGSAKTFNGPSLNENLLVGPTLQRDIFSILLTFRFFRVAMSADIGKMYRQIMLAPSDRDFHRILWRDNQQDPIRIMRMTRVTYGISSSAFHSIRTLQDLAERDQGSNVADAVKRDFYVDDLLTGASCLKEAFELQDGLLNLLNSGGMKLRKWVSNNNQVIERLPEDLRETAGDVHITDGQTIKVLGIRWSPEADVFKFDTMNLNDGKMTKRAILSESSKLFDPTGFLSPVTIAFKCLIQECWAAGCDWDQLLPLDIADKWMKLREELSILHALRVPRRVLSGPQNQEFSIHLFTDASERAYAAAIYVRSTNGQTQLFCSKTRVAPAKTISLPRLELCAAVLGTRLYKASLQAIESIVQPKEVIAWTDSTIVLSWISRLPSTWKCFVANRVSEIQQTIEPQHWRHVPSQSNPADLASRGIYPSQIVSNTLWWEGPQWLKESPTTWPKREQPSSSEDLPDIRQKNPNVFLSCENTIQTPDPLRFSKLSRLINTMACVWKFIHLIAKRNINPSELAWKAELEILRSQQLVDFGSSPSIKDLNPFLKLSPFIDSNTGLIRVGGRLSQSEHSQFLKHPILLLSSSHVATLYARDAHLKTMHGGPQLSLAHLRQRVWIAKGKRLVKNIISSCSVCRRYMKNPQPPLMGPLPKERITQARPFEHTGIDYAGPISVRPMKRSKVRLKAYIALFVCFVTKACHLELVYDLTSEACTAALRRFTSRRGVPTNMYSDNATTFVGCNNSLIQMMKKITESQLKMNWVMIPPRAPHFGGLWEAGVKSMKSHLKRVMGASILTMDEVGTLLIQIEGILNSRPLTPLSESPDDPSPLTPAHFLMSYPLMSLPQPQLLENSNHLNRWKQVQSMVQGFWDRWHKEYLTTLQQKSKWMKPSVEYCVGDIVFIIEDNTAPLSWPIGKIVALYDGNDGISRVARLKLARTSLIRPVVKIKPLICKNI